jgi:hypothetical protein
MLRSLASRLTLPLAALLLPVTVLAGTLCGTVRDRQTNAPIANAGVFLRKASGAYTGHYGATNAAGSFCIANLPGGTYDVEVRVDDYQVAYLRGVLVYNTTDVEVTGELGGVRLLPAAPNPARESARVAWTMPAPARVTLALYDVRGRRVRAWRSESLPAGAHAIAWDLNDAEGAAVGPGIYFVHLQAGGVLRVGSVTVVR